MRFPWIISGKGTGLWGKSKNKRVRGFYFVFISPYCLK